MGEFLLILLIAIPLFGWLILSPIVFIWWFFDPDARDRFKERHPRVEFAVFIGAFLCICGIFFLGIERVLVFIPGHWGRYDVDGGFIATRLSIASILSLFLGFFFIVVFERFEKIRCENQRLTMIAERDKWKEELRHMSRARLKEKQGDIEAKLNDSPLKDYDEKQVLKDVLDAIEAQILLLDQQHELRDRRRRSKQ